MRMVGHQSVRAKTMVGNHRGPMRTKPSEVKKMF